MRLPQGIAVWLAIFGLAGLALLSSAAAAGDDLTPPTGTVTINAGTPYTGSSSVTLALKASDNPGGSGMAAMQIRNDNPRIWPAQTWQPFQTPFSWNLLPGAGPKTVYVKFRDRAGNGMRSPAIAAIFVDTAPPYTSASRVENRWHNAPVAVTLTARDRASGVAETLYSTDGSAPAIPYTGPITVSAAGLTTVRFFSTDRAGNLEPVRSSPAIRIDLTAPAAPLVTDDGDWTNSTTRLRASWTSAADAESGITGYQYRIQTSSGAEIVPWSPTGAATGVTRTALALAQGATYFVEVQSKNGAGTWSAISSSDGITVDTEAPAAAMTINAAAAAAEEASTTRSGAAVTASRNVTLTLTAADTVSGIHRMQFSNDGAVWSALAPYAASRPWALSAGDGQKTVSAKVEDKAGNLSNPVTATIRLDTTAPLAPGRPILTGNPDQDQGIDIDGDYTVEWSPAADAAGAISAYELQERSGTGAWQTLTSTLALPSHSVTGRTHATSYTYRVRAKDEANLWSPWSGSSEGIVIDLNAPIISAITPADGPGYTEGDALTITAAASDADGDPLEYQFSAGGVLKRPWSASPSFKLPTAGLLGEQTLTVEARDRFGRKTQAQATVYGFRPPIPPPAEG